MEKKKSKIKTASLPPVMEFRKMRVGQTVRFPLSQYNPNTLRSLKSSALALDRSEGKDWKTKLDFADQSTKVTRVS